MLDALPAPVYATDAEGRLTYFNRAVEQLAGRRPMIGVDRWCVTARLLSADGTPLAHEDSPMAVALRENRAVRGEEIIAERPDGSRVHVSPYPTPIRDEDGRLIGAVNVLLDISARKRAEDEVAHLATHDPLTRLPNRLSFSSRLDRWLADRGDSCRPFAVLKVDVVDFRHIDDTFGLAAGDKALRAVASRLAAAAGDTFLAHVGSDAFALIVDAIGGRDGIRRFAEDLRRAVAGTGPKARGVDLDVVIGCALFPSDGGDEATLLAHASSALSRAKSRGNERVVFFDADADLADRERQSLRGELRHAIEDGALALHYQPQVGRDGSVRAVEALVRWKHPLRGMIPPAAFIPLAEEDGAIVAMSEWILRIACREAASWPIPIGIAVNISPVHFRRDDLPDLVREVLAETGLSPARLELEITEGVMVHDFEQAMSMLHKLRAIGVRIALDDFGTGYSSLSYLQAFPLTTLKIDRSFTANLGSSEQSAAIVRSVIGLGHALGLDVAAEGIESREQLDFLIAEGCDLLQGFYVGRPAEIGAWSHLVGRGAAREDEAQGLRSA